MRSGSDAVMKRWLRFLAGGGINTAFTYAVYLGLNRVMPYQAAYFIAFALGIVFAYWFNAVVVFRVPLSWKGLFSYPVVYVVQYVASAFLLGGLVEVLGIKQSLAPLVVSVVMVPVTYVMSRFVIGWTSRTKTEKP
jgi:putative flippase GtrA